MKILFIFGYELALGGHFKSAQTLAKALHAQGHQVFAFLQGDDPRLLAEFEKVDVPVFKVKPGIADRMPAGKLRTLARMVALTRQLLQVIRKNGIDVLHAQDRVFIRHAYLASLFSHKKLICTKAGGECATLLIPSGVPLVAYSQELIDGYKKLTVPFRPERIEILRARIDLELYQPGEKNSELLASQEIPDEALVFLLAIRLHEQKRPWIESVFSLATRVQSSHPVRIVIAGSGELYSEVCERASRFNVESVSVKIIPVGGITEADKMREWVVSSDVVVGNGRGLMEAMACGRAAMIAGERGELALLTAENMEEAAYWNFSGRHFRLHPDFDRTGPIRLDDVEIQKAAEEGQRYVRENYDANKGAEKLLELYTEERPRLRWREYLFWEIRWFKHNKRKEKAFESNSNHLFNQVLEPRGGGMNPSDDIIVDVRRLNLEEKEQAGEFVYKAFPERARFKFPEKWEWQFANNPWSDPERLGVYIAERNGSFLGQTAAMRVPCKIGPESVIMGWSVDTFVLPETRGLGLGKRLQTINQKDNEYFASLSMSEANRRIKLKLGGVLGPKAILYRRTIRFSPPKTGTPRIYKMADFCAYVTLRFLEWMQASHKKNNCEIVIKGPCEADFHQGDEDVWLRARDRFDLAVERNRKYLNWRYKQQPWTEHYCFRAFDKDEKQRGLLICRELSESALLAGCILECFDDQGDEKVQRELLESAARFFSGRGVSCLIAGSSDNITQRALRAEGYLEIENKQLVFHGPPSTVDTLSENTSALLTIGDQDLDDYPSGTRGGRFIFVLKKALSCRLRRSKI